CEVVLGKGEAVLLSGAEPQLVALANEQFFVFRVPWSLLSPIVGNLDAVLVRPIPKDGEALRLLVNYADGIRKIPMLPTTEVRHMAAANIRDLIALTLGATRDAAELANGRGLRAARLQAIKTDIVHNIGRSNLSVGEVASRHRVTPRYVQMLFETEGTTFTD